MSVRFLMPDEPHARLDWLHYGHYYGIHVIATDWGGRGVICDTYVVPRVEPWPGESKGGHTVLQERLILRVILSWEIFQKRASLDWRSRCINGWYRPERTLIATASYGNRSDKNCNNRSEGNLPWIRPPFKGATIHQLDSVHKGPWSVFPLIASNEKSPEKWNTDYL